MMMCKRKTFVGAINSATVETYGVYTFRLSLLPAFNEFQGLFEQYKINGVLLEFYPTQSESNMGSGSTLQIPMFHWVFDCDDGTPPTSSGEIFQYNNIQTRRADRPFKYFCRPKVLREAFQNALTPSYLPARSAYVSTSSPDALHYGVKWFYDAGGANAATSMKVWATYYLSFKSVR